MNRNLLSDVLYFSKHHVLWYESVHGRGQMDTEQSLFRHQRTDETGVPQNHTSERDGQATGARHRHHNCEWHLRLVELVQGIQQETGTIV